MFLRENSQTNRRLSRHGYKARAETGPSPHVIHIQVFKSVISSLHSIRADQELHSSSTVYADVGAELQQSVSENRGGSGELKSGWFIESLFSGHELFQIKHEPEH